VRSTWIGAALLSFALVAAALIGGPCDEAGRVAPSIMPAIAPIRRPMPRPRADAAPAPTPVTASAADLPTPASTAPREIIIRVVDAAGAPVANAWVRVNRGAYALNDAGTRTDADGVVQETATGEVMYADVVPDAASDRCLLPYVGDVAISESSEARVVVHEGAPIRGRLIGPDDEPIAAAVVMVRGPHHFRNDATVDSDGRFVLAAPPGSHVELRVRTRYSAEVHDVDAGATDVLVRCRRTLEKQTITIRVVDPDGAPVSSADVWLIRANSGQMDDYLGCHRTGEDGRCRIEDLPGCELSVFAYSADDHNAISLPHLVVPDGRETTVPLRRAVFLRGVVATVDGLAMENVLVMARFDGVFVAQGFHKDGRFSLKLAADQPGPLRVAATAQSGGALQTGAIDVDLPCADDLRIVLRRK
jgi:hypothetical protein